MVNTYSENLFHIQDITAPLGLKPSRVLKADYREPFLVPMPINVSINSVRGYEAFDREFLEAQDAFREAVSTPKTSLDVLHTYVTVLKLINRHLLEEGGYFSKETYYNSYFLPAMRMCREYRRYVSCDTGEGTANTLLKEERRKYVAELEQSVNDAFKRAALSNLNLPYPGELGSTVVALHAGRGRTLNCYVCPEVLTLPLDSTARLGAAATIRLVVEDVLAVLDQVYQLQPERDRIVVTFRTIVPSRGEKEPVAISEPVQLNGAKSVKKLADKIVDKLSFFARNQQFSYVDELSRSTPYFYIEVEICGYFTVSKEAAHKLAECNIVYTVDDEYFREIFKPSPGIKTGPVYESVANPVTGKCEVRERQAPSYT
jgi:hypothetical protein